MKGIIFWLPVLVSIALLSFGLKSTIKLDHIEENKCNMSYMFNPDYVRVPTKSEILDYTLYFYKNPGQRFDLSGKMDSGTPVLFIPGNAGGKYQIRSFASFCFGSTKSDLIDPLVRDIVPQKHNFHYYTIDFNSEFSVFDGRILSRQSKFVQDSLISILSLYSHTKTNKSPKKVILIGHSMGGVVATGIFLNHSDQLNSFVNHVDLIYTINTPHKPILLSRPSLIEYYNQINSIMKSDALINVTIISFHGGIRDIEVKSDLSHIEGTNKYSFSTSQIPSVWASTDHQSSLWCNQFVLKFVKSLHALVDSKTGQITESIDLRKKIISTFFKSAVSTSIHLDTFEKEQLKETEKENVDLNKIIDSNSFKLIESLEKRESAIEFLDNQVVCYGIPKSEEEFFSLFSNVDLPDNLFVYICDSTKVNCVSVSNRVSFIPLDLRYARGNHPQPVVSLESGVVLRLKKTDFKTKSNCTTSYQPIILQFTQGMNEERYSYQRLSTFFQKDFISNLNGFSSNNLTVVVISNPSCPLQISYAIDFTLSLRGHFALFLTPIYSILLGVYAFALKADNDIHGNQRSVASLLVLSYSSILTYIIPLLLLFSSILSFGEISELVSQSISNFGIENDAIRDLPKPWVIGFTYFTIFGPLTLIHFLIVALLFVVSNLYSFFTFGYDKFSSYLGFVLLPVLIGSSISIVNPFYHCLISVLVLVLFSFSNRNGKELFLDSVVSILYILPILQKGYLFAMYFKGHEMSYLHVSQDEKIITILLISHLMLSLCFKEARTKSNSLCCFLLIIQFIPPFLNYSKICNNDYVLALFSISNILMLFLNYIK